MFNILPYFYSTILSFLFKEAVIVASGSNELQGHVTLKFVNRLFQIAMSSRLFQIAFPIIAPTFHLLKVSLKIRINV
jgi:hypothetical protein